MAFSLRQKMIKPPKTMNARIASKTIIATSTRRRVLSSALSEDELLSSAVDAAEDTAVGYQT
jgi:hypothetical protein